jgi:H+-transporting ATPase
VFAFHQTDFGIILALLIVNACIGFIEETRAESAIDALRSTLAAKTTCVRGGQLREVDARELVPGDIISLRLGDIVPADAKLLGLTASFEPTKHELSIDQSALTGESLPVLKGKDAVVWSGTVVKQGQQLAMVTHTAEKTFLGRAAHLISNTEDSGHFQAVITKIGNFIIVITLVMVFIILMVAVGKGENFIENLDYALVLTIASIPVVCIRLRWMFGLSPLLTSVFDAGLTHCAECHYGGWREAARCQTSDCEETDCCGGNGWPHSAM